MAPIVIAAILIGVPIALIFLLQVNAALVFLSLCAGSVLVQFVSSDTSNIFNSFFPANGTVNYSIVQLCLLFAPAFFTAIFLRRSVSGAKNLMNIIPAAATGAACALLAVPLLPGGVQHNIVSTNIWKSLEQYQSVIIAAAVVISVFSLWANKPKHDKKGKHKK